LPALTTPDRREKRRLVDSEIVVDDFGFAVFIVFAALKHMIA
jgi:hypothetical protein